VDAVAGRHPAGVATLTVPPLDLRLQLVEESHAVGPVLVGDELARRLRLTRTRGIGLSIRSRNCSPPHVETVENLVLAPLPDRFVRRAAARDDSTTSRRVRGSLERGTPRKIFGKSGKFCAAARTRYRSRVGRPLLAALAVILLLAGCGGGSGAPRLSRAEFVAKADAICRTYNRQSRAIARPKSLAELATAIDKVVPLLDQSVQKLQKLRPPKDEQADVDRWIAGVQRLEDDLRSVQDKAAKKDSQGVQAALQAGAVQNKRSNALAGKLGMSVCST
jgi:hypothetical protein